ncbi:MAG TPA: hypothetical protein VE591_03350 [Candidatus Acidoferrum sp.]|nr:hypothetical protein [Candidatus Acidoferrum sp.]
MNSIVRAACALLLAIGTLGAAPSPRPYGPVPPGAQTVTVKRYVDALRAGHYDVAYALLADDERAYFRNAEAFRSIFAADGVTLREATLVGARGTDRGRVYFVREKLSYLDHKRDVTQTLEAIVPLGVLPEHGTQHIKDPGKPYRAAATTASADASGLRVTVKKIEFWPDRISLIVTFTNLSDSFVTVLPYGKSVLRDNKGSVYRLIAIKNWTVTDKQLYQGVPLAPNAQYTGSIAFTASRLDDPTARAFSLDIAPALREGADAPFDVTVAIAPR